MSEVKTITIPVQGANGAFANLLGGIKRGALLSKCDDALKEVSQAVILTGSKGKLTVVINIESDGKAEGTDSPMLTIDGDVSIKKPSKKVGKSKWYADDDGNLIRNDPKQTEIKFGTIEGGKSETPAGAAPAAANG